MLGHELFKKEKETVTSSATKETQAKQNFLSFAESQVPLPSLCLPSLHLPSLRLSSPRSPSPLSPPPLSPPLFLPLLSFSFLICIYPRNNGFQCRLLTCLIYPWGSVFSNIPFLIVQMGQSRHLVFVLRKHLKPRDSWPVQGARGGIEGWIVLVYFGRDLHPNQSYSLSLNPQMRSL